MRRAEPTLGAVTRAGPATVGPEVRAGIGHAAPGRQHPAVHTATSDFALKETFGSDGAPGSLTDFDHCDTLFIVGHNPAETHTVLWARILDRLAGPNPPRLVVVDPRRTKVARAASTAPRSLGTGSCGCTPP